MTRAKDCRALLLAAEKQREDSGEPTLLSVLMQSRKIQIVSPFMLLLVHLLWDDEWLPTIATLQPPLEVHVASIAAGAIINIDTSARARMETDHLVRNIRILQKQSNVEKGRDCWLGLGRFYPAVEYDTPITELLSRCKLVCSMLTPLHLKSYMRETIFECKFAELLAASIDMRGMEAAQKVSFGIF
jgi:hypothetical protein